MARGVRGSAKAHEAPRANTGSTCARTNCIISTHLKLSGCRLLRITKLGCLPLHLIKPTAENEGNSERWVRRGACAFNTRGMRPLPQIHKEFSRCPRFLKLLQAPTRTPLEALLLPEIRPFQTPHQKKN